jgi:EAL domain-containing protein (putative c-di-GMP-specific phosphodiesterase class I)
MLNKHDDRTLLGDISINLNIATLLSPEFLVFDDNLKAGMRGTIVLELQKIDIYADLGAYLFARDFAHDRGYRICIDGLNHLTLPFVDRERLGADLVKLNWDPEMSHPPHVAALRAAVERASPSRVVLCRCESRQAIDFGQSLGVSLFQGRFVEALLTEENRRRGNPLRKR